MTDLIPNPSLDAVPQIETSTLVLGGFGGPANQQAQALLNRQAYFEDALANNTDPLMGGGKIGWTRSALTGQIDNTGKALSSQPVSAWEFENFITDKPNPSDISTWDWAPAVNEALSQWGECKLPNGNPGVATPIIIIPGAKLSGHGPRYAGGTAYSNIFGTSLIARAGFVGSQVITSTITPPDNVLTSIGMKDFQLDLNACAEHGVVLTDTYDGSILDNLHIIGSAPDKRGLWFAQGSYGLGQTVNMRGVQVIARDNSTATISPFRADALNESVFVGCKFFGSFGGVNASLGACVELSGCGGIVFSGCSTAFGDVGISLVDHATRKNYGIDMDGCTFEALRTTAVKVRGSASRKATQIYIRSPRYYDSVYTMTNAIDVDFVEQSVFECSFKHAIVGAGADQNTVYIQRQSFVTNTGTNTNIISQPNAIDAYYGISARIRAFGGITVSDTILANGGLGQRVSTFTAATGTINKADRVVFVNRATVGTYGLPAANIFGAGLTQVVTVRGIGAGSIVINPAGADTIEGTTTLAIATGGTKTLASDGISAWYVIG